VNIFLRYFIGFAAFSSIAFTSCKEKEKADPYASEKGSYFSVKKLSLDEWETHAGEPISFVKTVKDGNKVDSSFVNIEHLDWVSILETFTATDISDRSFLGKYSFNQFEDEFDNTRNFMYEANDKDLFTRKLLITMDSKTMLLKGIYIETLKKSLLGERQQKLYYSPIKTIQIQESFKPIIGSKSEKITKYVAVGSAG
jgi:hypothetical protein